MIVNFPSQSSDEDLHRKFEEMGYNVDNVRGLSHSKGLRLQDGKSLYAFVNMRDASSASSFKKACDAKKIVMMDEMDRRWEVSADWAKCYILSNSKLEQIFLTSNIFLIKTILNFFLTIFNVSTIIFWKLKNMRCETPRTLRIYSVGDFDISRFSVHIAEIPKNVSKHINNIYF